ncbi:MAG: TspO/MBR family protein [Clostridia bacterium]|nr:TspO/MBR family protein [Clostridia bacterium]
MNKPFFAPPAILFPIVWTILYILMGISSYLVYTSSATKEDKKTSLTFYGVQLILNSLWTLLFFRFNLYLFSYIWILLIIVFLGITMYKFYKIKPLSAFLQIPYLLWLIFASILNFSIYILN